MKKIYLIASIAGAIIPLAFFFGFIQQNGVDLPAFISALFINGLPVGSVQTCLSRLLCSGHSCFSNKHTTMALPPFYSSFSISASGFHAHFRRTFIE